MASDSDTGKRVAKWAALGAVAAIPIPFVGPITGAVVGACVGFYRSRQKR